MRILCGIIIVLLIGIASPARAAFPVNFLEDEAGMGAYFQFASPTNLQSNLLRNLFRTITFDKPGYLVGWLPMEGYEGYPGMDLKVFIHNDGWVVAYFPSSEASAKMFNTLVDQPNRLQRALARVAAAMEVNDYELHYAHFQYPEARRMATLQMRAAGTRSFDFRLPGASQFYDRSYYIYAAGLFTSVNFNLDGRTAANVGNAIQWKTVQAQDLVTNAKHIGELRASMAAGYFGMTFLYTGPDDPIVNGVDSLHFYDLPAVPVELMETAKDVLFFLEVYLPVVTR